MTDLNKIDYHPPHFVEGTSTMRVIEDPITLDPDSYVNVDAIYHYFESCDGKMPNTDSGEDRKMGHVDAIAMLIANRFETDRDCVVDSASPEVEPSWQQYRRTTSFIAGALTDGYMSAIKRELPKCMSVNTVFLDGSAYADEHGVNDEPDAFNKLMSLAGNTKGVIENSLAVEYAHDARGAIKFLNAEATDQIDPPSGTKFDEVPTKWMVEARYLANELVKIREFRKNFNTVVIYNAHRFIVSDQLNLTKLYRLMAKLGRINTRIVFVG